MVKATHKIARRSSSCGFPRRSTNGKFSLFFSGIGGKSVAASAEQRSCFRWQAGAVLPALLCTFKSAIPRCTAPPLHVAAALFSLELESELLQHPHHHRHGQKQCSASALRGENSRGHRRAEAAALFQQAAEQQDLDGQDKTRKSEKTSNPHFNLPPGLQLISGTAEDSCSTDTARRALC
eukprot:3087114-Rhodomonas_salina.3